MSKQALILSAGLLGLLGMGLSACGQKGPLFLPPAAAPSDAASAPPSPTPAPTR